MAVVLLASAGWRSDADQPRDAADNYPRAVRHSPLQNLIEAAPGLYSGSEPRGSEAFEQLHALGIRTVVSVDGARPDIESAARFGIGYVHIPIGYDGIPNTAAAALTRVMRDADGPVYVHCHHGKHRGPAAAAICGIAVGSLDHAGADRLLQLAETNPDYAGLWRDVAAFQPLPADAELPELREVSEVESLTEAMARISRNFDRLKELLDPPADPEASPHRVSLLIAEDLTESARNLTGDYDAEVRELMDVSAAAASRLTESLRNGDAQQVESDLNRLSQSCSACHESYRN